MFQNVKYCTTVTFLTYTLAELLDDFGDLGVQIDTKLKFHKHTDMVKGVSLT